MEEPSLDDELVQDYLAECREHLATIDIDVLALEEAGTEFDERTVNRIFRAAHSIKGGAGVCGLVKIRDLAHQLEDALDLIRTRRMQPTTDVTSVLLLGFDQIRELLGNHRESNQADTSEFAAALAALTADAPQPEDGQPGPAFDWSRQRKGSKRTYLIEYNLIGDIQRRNKTNREVFRNLLECGTIVETALDLDSAGTLDGEPSDRLTLHLIYATVLDPELIGHLVEVPPERIGLVGKDGAVTPLAGTAAGPVARTAAPHSPLSSEGAEAVGPLPDGGSQVVIRPSEPAVVAATVPELRAKMRRLVEAGVRLLVVDFGNVRMVDSAGIGLLLSAHSTLCKLGGRLSVIHASKEILRLLQSMRMHQHFSVSGD
ncbi:hypothetical protein SBA3_2700034 [Candidatus Sulfopaludibacter sp. SbA3]|nr:hypothetical protein SBA3_2700034 [Candidatus Sulfopaludibacter sp. SbA3]